MQLAERTTYIERQMWSDREGNEGIGDDTKAAARQNPNCIKKYGERRFSIWRMELLHPAMWHDHDIDFARWVHLAMRHVALETWQWIQQLAAPRSVTRSSGIMTLNSPGGGTLQCGRWLTDDMPSNSPKRPPYWKFTSGFDFDHTTAVDMSFCTRLRNFIKMGPPSAEKNDVMSIFIWRISAILDFRGPIMGSLKSPYTTSYRSSIATILHIALNWLVFEKIAFFCILATDRLTNRQMDSTNTQSALAVESGGLITIYMYVSSSAGMIPDENFGGVATLFGPLKFSSRADVEF